MKEIVVDQSIQTEDVILIEDRPTLSNLFWYHRSDNVALAALGKLIEMNQVTSLLNYPPARKHYSRLASLGPFGIKQISKPEVLYWIALRNPLGSLKRQAIDQIHEEIHLIELLIRISKEYWHQIIDKISFDSVISAIEKTKDFSLIIHILDRIKRKDLLPRIIEMKSDHPELMVRLLNTITDQEILIHIVRDSKNTMIRKKAVSKIKDEAIVKDIISWVDKLDIALHAIGEIRDQEFLKTLAIENTISPVTEVAMNGIKDQEWFKQIFEANGELLHIGKLAFDRIHDENFIMDYTTRKFPHLNRYFLLEVSQRLTREENIIKFAALARLHGYHEIARGLHK